MQRPRILIAEDHRILLDGLRKLLEGSYEVVGAVTDGQALVRAAEELHPDLVLTDITMPLLSGLQATRQIKEAGLECRVVLLTMHLDPELAQEALRAGASGYLCKSSPTSELEAAIREALEGRVYLARELRQPSAQTAGAGADSAFTKLSPRQREVLQLIAEGGSHKDIAANLHVSVKTVEFHKYQIMDILGLRTTAELARFAARHHLVSLETPERAPAPAQRAERPRRSGNRPATY
jgi:DNA-binding NarL/FixJ family response regulator